MKSKPIRVLQFICSTGFYGAEKWILALADNSRPNEVEHTLAVSKEPGMDELELFRQYKCLNLPAYEIDMSHKFDLSVIRKIANLIKDNHIDVIHTHGYKSDIVGLCAAKKAGIHCISTPHGFENSPDLKLKLFMAMGCQTYRFFDVVVPLSEALRIDVLRYGVKEDRLKLVNNAVNLKELYEKDGQNAIAADMHVDDIDSDFVVGYVGQLISRKNINELLLAFAEVHKKHGNTRLLLVGEGEQKDSLENTAESLGVRDAVTFTGFVSDPVSYFRKMNVFVMTSALEGIPRSMMEAMSLGIPVIAYDIPGVDLLVSHNKTGILVKNNNTVDLRREIERSIIEPAIFCSMAENAMNMISEHFSAVRMASEYQSIYKNVLGLELT